MDFLKKLQWPHIQLSGIPQLNLNKMKLLLTITALLEGVTGLALVILPSLLVSILLGTSLTDPGAILIGRLAGAVLIAIAIVCWLLKSDIQSSLMVKVMLGYNIFTITLHKEKLDEVRAKLPFWKDGDNFMIQP